VANNGSDNVSVIRASDNTVVATVPVGQAPIGVAATPDGGFVYVTNFGSSNVSVIRTVDNTVVATVAVAANASGIAITPNGAYVYVTTYASKVSVIRTSDNTVVANVTVGANPSAVAITPNGAYAYVTNGISSSVSVIRTSDNTVVTTISGTTWPFGIAITPNGQYAYVTTIFHDGSNAGHDPVSVLRLSDNTIVGTVLLDGTSDGAAVSPSGATAYVVHGYNRLAVVRTSDNTLVTDVTLGDFNHTTNQIALTADGAYAYVTSIDASVGYPGAPGGVFVMRTSDNSLVKTVTVGNVPHGVAIADVPTPAEQVGQLSDVIAGLQLASGTATSLQKKLDRAAALLAAGDTAGACAALLDFLNEVSAQAGKKITTADADRIISTVSGIRAQIGC
jgi:YVTN family beta-propeller protein